MAPSKKPQPPPAETENAKPISLIMPQPVSKVCGWFMGGESRPVPTKKPRSNTSHRSNKHATKQHHRRGSTTLDSLPLELVQAIFSELENFSDKNHFVQTCRIFYLASNFQIYRDAASSPDAALHRIFSPQFTGDLDIRQDRTRRKSLMNRLLDAGLSVDHECADGRTLLMVAEGNNDLLMMGLLLDRGANVNARLNTHRYSAPKSHAGSALHNAVNAKRPGAARLLMQYGADLDMLNDYGETPLNLAISWNCVEMVEDLLFFGAGVDTTTRARRSRSGRYLTPLHVSLFGCAERIRRSPNPRIVMALLEHGANANLKLRRGRSLLTRFRTEKKRLNPQYRKTLERVERLLLVFGAEP